MQNAMISAAEFLYRHSPAAAVSAEKNILVVSGDTDNELANAFYQLLFSVACQPEASLLLIRLVPGDAMEKELDFVCRNQQGIGAFANSEWLKEGPPRPLTIQFLNSGEAGLENLADRIAFSIQLEAGGQPLPGLCSYTVRDVPLLRPRGEAWSSADEEACQALRLARRVHTAYTAGWNSRYREDKISQELYESASDYSLRSSLRFAVSIPWKLAAIGVPLDENAAEALCRRLNEDPGGIRDTLAWQEHRSWSAFMTLEGWTAPTREELRDYLFRNGNDHRCIQEKKHPCLCDLLTDDWRQPYPKRLKQTSIRQWSQAVNQLEDYCLLDRASLLIHHRCKEIVTSEAYQSKMRGLFRALEDALLQAGLDTEEQHMRQLQLMENMFSRLCANETNSYTAWRSACSGFCQAIRREQSPAAARLLALYDALEREARAAVERNKYCDYKEIDAGIIRWLPWILHTQRADTVWKLFAPSNMLENVLSSIILRPRALNIVCQDADLSALPLPAFRTILARHGVEPVSIRAVPVSSLADQKLPVSPGDVVDVTGCGEMQHSLILPPDARTVYYGQDDLQDKAGAPFFSPLYHPYDFTMTVDEMLLLRGRQLLSDTENNEMLGLEADYETLWRVSRDAQRSSSIAWHAAIEALKAAEQAVQKRIYSHGSQQPFSFSFDPAAYARLLQNGAIQTLHALQEAHCITDLFIDVEQGRLSFRYSLGPDADEPSAPVSQDLLAMLTDPAPDSQYAVVSDYVASGDAYRYMNLNQPLRLQEPLLAGLRKLAQAGLLRRGGDGRYHYKSLPVRRGLEQEGFALEAYAYYTLFLSGLFDDIRSNVRIKTGVRALGGIQEKELDILVTRRGSMGVISCKDSASFSIAHIGELKMQSELYGINARPVLICSKPLAPEYVNMCAYLNVALIPVVNENLPQAIVRALQ